MRTVLPCSRWFRRPASFNAPAPRNYPCLPNTCDPSAESSSEKTMAHPTGGRNPNGVAPCFGRDCAAGLIRSADVDTLRVAADTTPPPLNAGSPPMKRLLSPILFTAVAISLPVAAQTPPTQGWPANRPPTPQPGPQA